jgi:hypothetical protein
VVVGGETGLAKMMKEMIDTVKLLIYPVLKLIADVIGGMVGGLMSIIKGLSGFVGGFANIITGIFTGNGDLVLKGLKMMILGVAGVISGIIDMIIINPLNVILKALKHFELPGGWKPFHGVDTIKTLSSRVEDAMNSLAVGTPMVPNDMIAQIHKGEMIVPSNFAESLRNGDLALSGGKGYNNSTPINIYVAGSVVTERDLVKSVTEGIKKYGKQGYL